MPQQSWLTLARTDIRSSAVFASALFLAGFLGASLRATHYFDAVPGDIGDARFNSFVLEHIYLWVLGLQPHLWSPDFFYPNPGTLTFSDNHLGSAVFYVPFRLAGLSRELAFDVWFLLSFVLNFAACFHVLRRLGFARASAAAGAFVFTFALPVIVRDGHAQLLYRFAVPLAVLALIDAWRERRLALLWKVAAWVTVQFFCTIYIGVFLLYLLAAIVIALFLRSERGTVADLIRSLAREPRQHLILAGVVSAVALAALAWLLVPYLTYARAYGFSRSVGEIRSMLPRLGSYLIGDRSPYTGFIGAWVDGIPMRHEHQMFIGVGSLVLMIGGIVAIARKAVAPDKLYLGIIAVLALALLFAGTLTIGRLTLYGPLMYVPGTNSIRGVCRIILVMLLPIAILSAVGVEWLLSRLAWARDRVVWPVALAIIALLGFEPATYVAMATPISHLRDRLETVRKAVPEPLSATSILWLRGYNAAPDWATSLDAMLFAQDNRIPTLNGYSGNAPPNTLTPTPCTTPAMQLAAWARFSGMPQPAQDALSQRVVTVSLSPCPPGGLDLRQRPLAPGVARQIGLEIDSAQQSGTRIKAVVTIRNGTQERFVTNSIDGRDVRLSWRIVPLNGEPMPSPGWMTRQDLHQSLAPGASTSIPVEIVVPKPPGDYALEFSLVEELVRWFHDDGLVPPRHVFRVPQ